MIDRTDTLTFTSSTKDYWSNIIYNYLSQYMTGLTHETDSEYIIFNDEFKLRIRSTNEGANLAISLVYINTSEEIMYPSDNGVPGYIYMLQNGNHYIRFISNNDFTIFMLKRQWGNTISILIFKDEDGNKYVGGMMSNAGDARVWENIEYFYNNDYFSRVYCVNNVNKQGTQYRIITPFGYSKASGYIDVSPVALAANTDYGLDSFVIKGISSCSTITKGSKIQLADNSKWLAISPNHLINIDEEVSE